jgi:tetratricopeptide (TPR) repeat protein
MKYFVKGQKNRRVFSRSLVLLAIGLVGLSCNKNKEEVNPEYVKEIKETIVEFRSTTISAEELYNLALATAKKNPSEALSYSKELAAAGKQNKSTLLVAYAHHVEGYAHFLQGDYLLAIDHYLPALTSMKLVKDKYLVLLLKDMGLLHYKLELSEEALIYFDQALKLEQMLQSSPDQHARIYRNMAFVYQDQTAQCIV